MTPTAEQLLLVLASDGAASNGVLYRYARRAPADWQAEGDGIAVTLGRNGLASGLDPQAAAMFADLPPKQEGDGRTPAGRFGLTRVFGDAAADAPEIRALRMPYIANHCHLKCVDDPASAYYNLLVDMRHVPAVDWQSAEDMQRADARYRLGVVVAHNAAPPRPGLGSCIFLHVWAGPGVPTAGCTAAAFADVQAICQWLEACCNPQLVVLPEAAYWRLRVVWDLPPIDR